MENGKSWSHVLVSVSDVKAGTYSPPVPEYNLHVAKRNFAMAVSQAQGALGEFPQDFVLVHVGYWYEDLGLTENLPNGNVPLGSGSEVELQHYPYGVPDEKLGVEQPEKTNLNAIPNP